MHAGGPSLVAALVVVPVDGVKRFDTSCATPPSSSQNLTMGMAPSKGLLPSRWLGVRLQTSTGITRALSGDLVSTSNMGFLH